MTPPKRSLVPAAALMAARLCIAGIGLGSSAAGATDLMVRFDQSQLLRLPRPATEVIIGNPSIADVAIQGGNLLVVTGKMFGITNIIALDAQRNVIQDQRVVVERDDQRTVMLYKGHMRESYSCTPGCSPTITVGDDTEFFDRVSKAALTKNSASSGAIDKSTQGSSE